MKQAIAVAVENELAAHEFRNRIRRPQVPHLANGSTNRSRLSRSPQTGQSIEPARGVSIGIEGW
jgi:hypothetical protein